MNCGGVSVLIKERVQRASLIECEICWLENCLNGVSAVGEFAKVLHVGAASIYGVSDFAWCCEVMIGNIEVGLVCPVWKHCIIDIAGSVGATKTAGYLEELIT